MDWSNLIATLQKSGLTREQIAEKAGCSKHLINALARGDRGSRLSYDIGYRLVMLRDSLSQACPN